MGSRIELIRKHLKQEEEDDDELFFVLVPAIYASLYSKKRLVHTSCRSGARKIREMLDGHESWCKFEFRMEPEIFRAIASYLRREGLLQDTSNMSIEEHLGIFMYMISQNASNAILQKEFQHSGETIHRKTSEFFGIIPALTQRFVKLPSVNQPHVKITSNPRFWPYFQNCIGAIDGTHVPITISEERAPPFRNRKGTLSQNVMLACDFDLNFTFISCGWEGSASDAGVLQSALRKGFRVSDGKYYLVDGGYANTPSFIAPYRGVSYHLSEYRRRGLSTVYADYKELFNHSHALLRNHIERSIGVLKKRFPILKVGTFYPIETQVLIPSAAVSFHNMIRGLNGEDGWLDQHPTNINSSQFVELPEGDSNYQYSSQSNAGNALRDQIAMQMWNDYNNH
jgi:hypothetical protein